MIGYSNSKKGYRLYSLDRHQFIFSRDVKFFESVFPFKDSVTDKAYTTTNAFQDLNNINFFDNEYFKTPNDNERVDSSLNSDYRSQSDSSHSSVPGKGVNTVDFSSGNNGNDAQSSDDTFDAQNDQVTTLEENIVYEGNLDQNPSFSTQGVQNLRRSSRQTVFPRNYNDFVIESKVKYGLKKFVNYSKLDSENLYALLRNDTWKITQLPKDRKAIGSKWIFKIRYKSDGEIDRYKTRLVAKDFNQKEGIDYEETFSHVVKMVTVRCSLNLVVLNSWSIFQLNVNNAFLYGDLDETVYIKLPDGYFSVNDNRTKFMIKGLRKLKYFFGIRVIDTDKGICLNQRKYVFDLLSKYGMLACKPVRTPLQSKLVISNEAINDDPLLDNITDYQKLMGKLIYLTNTKHDISYVVHCLSQFMHFPLKYHLKIAFKILRYLKGSLGLGIHVPKSSVMTLKAYSDVDWAKCVVTRKYVT
ncbi:ribonuclease H-like domain-containing protein [Tanacetum coccineum]